MWQKILTFVLKFALSRLGADMDAEVQQQIDEYNRKKTEMEERQKQLAADSAELSLQISNRTQLRKLQSDELRLLEIQIENLDKRLGEINDDKNKKLADLNRLTDDDLLHSEL